eukprot:681460-Rhodomonas_salina.1
MRGAGKSTRGEGSREEVTSDRSRIAARRAREEARKRGTEEQRNRGTEEQRNRGRDSRSCGDDGKEGAR